MTEAIRLNQLKTGEAGRVIALNQFDHMRRRLQDIGFVHGTVVECIAKSPMGNPKAYLIKGAVIALRNEDSEQILIERF